MIALLPLLPLLAALLVLALPERPRLTRALALAAAALVLGRALDLLLVLPAPLRAPWIPALRVDLHLAADPLALPSLLLVALLTPAVLSLVTTRAARVAVLLIAAGLHTALLAADLALLAAVLALLSLAPLALASALPEAPDATRPAALSLALRLGLAAALTALAALLLALGHHDAHGGLWSFDLSALRTVVLPPDLELTAFSALAAASWLLLDLWPLRGPPLAGAPPDLALTSALRALGALLLARAVAVAPSAAALAAPPLAALAALAFALPLLTALGDRRSARPHHLGAALAALVPLGVLSATAEGLAGALLITIGLGLALPLLALPSRPTLPHSAMSPTPAIDSPTSLTTTPSRSPLPPLSARPPIAHPAAPPAAWRPLALLAAALTLAPGLTVTALALLANGSWTIPFARPLVLLVALLLTLAAALLAPRLLAADIPVPALAGLGNPAIGHTTAPTALGLTLAALLLALAPWVLTAPLAPATRAWFHALHAKRCDAEAWSPLRARPLAVDPGCAHPVADVRAGRHLRLAADPAPTPPPEPAAPDSGAEPEPTLQTPADLGILPEPPTSPAPSSSPAPALRPTAAEPPAAPDREAPR